MDGKTLTPDASLAELDFDGDGLIESAFFYAGTNSWQNASFARKVNWVPTGAAEGEHFSLALTMVPEYCVAADGSVDWDALGKGTTFEMPVVIDNTAPTVDDVSLSITSNSIKVTASDNQYVAAVALYDKSGTRLLAAAGAKQDIQPGETAVFQVPLDKVYGTKFILRVVDYAMNAVTYTLDMTLGEPLPQCMVFNLDDKYWASFNVDAPGDYKLWLDDPTFIWSATMADKMLFTGGRYGQLRIIDTDESYESYLVGDMGAVITDMAYNKADGEIYGIVDRKPVSKPDGTPDSNTESTLVRINKYTAEVEEVGTIGVSTNTLACDGNGTFYCCRYRTGEVYSFTLDTMAEPKLLTNVDGIWATAIQAMEYDLNRDVLCWISFSRGSSFYSRTNFFQINPTDGSYTMAEQAIMGELACLVIPEENPVNGAWARKTEQVDQLLISNENFSLLRGASEHLSVDVLPWNVSDHSVVWTSSDPKIVTVDQNGLITGVGAGEATVTVTSVLDPTMSASCNVVVNALETTLNGIMQDVSGTPKFFSWDQEHDNDWTAGTEIDTNFISAAYNAGKDVLYAMDSTRGSWAIHEIDMETGKTINTPVANTYGDPLWDMAYSSYWSTEDAPKIYGIHEANILLLADPFDLESGQLFELSTTLYQRTRGEIWMAIADAGAVNRYAVNAMTWAVETGLIQGMPGNLLSPKTNTTRA